MSVAVVLRDQPLREQSGARGQALRVESARGQALRVESGARRVESGASLS